MERVRYNNAYNVLRREMPSEAGEVRYATIALTAISGSSLLAATEVSIWGVASKTAVATLSVAVTAGDYTATISHGSETADLYPGDLLRIGGGTSYPDTLRVSAYNNSTHVVTFSEWFKNSHAVGETVVGRWVTRTLDTTTTTTWTDLLQFSAEWAFSAVGGSPLAARQTWSGTDLYEVEKRSHEQSDLETRFRARYRRYYDAIEVNCFERFADDALQIVRDLFEARGKDISKLIDSTRLSELHMAQIALSVAFAMGDDWEAERTAMTALRNDTFERLASLPLWSDTDDNLTKEDLETQTAQRPYPRRRLF